MAWDLNGPSGQQNADATAMEQRFLRLERRLALAEQRPAMAANATSDFIAHEGETVFVAAPAAGVTGLLPTPQPANRGSEVRLVCQTTGPVTLRAVSGTVNGRLSLTRQEVGTFALVSDGATGWWVESLGLPRPRDVVLQDWFCSGNSTSGQIGALGWNLGGVGTPTVARADSSMAATGKLTLTTTAVIADRTTLSLGQTEAADVAKPADVTLKQWVQSFNAVTATKRLFIGLSSNLATAPASVADSLGFLYDSAVSPNWLIIARRGSTGAAINTGIVASASDPLLSIWQESPMTFRFYAGNVLLGTIAGALAVSALPMNIGVRLETLAALATTHRLGYFGLSCRGLGAPYLADEFVKG